MRRYQIGGCFKAEAFQELRPITRNPSCADLLDNNCKLRPVSRVAVIQHPSDVRVWGAVNPLAPKSYRLCLTASSIPPRRIHPHISRKLIRDG